MKKQFNRALALLLVVVFAMTAMPFTTLQATAAPSADRTDVVSDVVAGDTEAYTYTVADGKATITGFNADPTGDVTLPSELGGAPVTAIAASAFRGCEAITGVVIPEGVTSIGASAFNGCRNLASATIPSTVSAIGGSAFYNCAALTDVVIPNAVTVINSYTFYGCLKLKTIDFGDGVTKIDRYAFNGCKLLGDVIITDTVKTFGLYVFNGCTALTIHTTEGTAAYNYAVANKISVVTACDVHTFGDIVVTTPATCSAAGVGTKTCSVCGYVETVAIDALAHEYEWVVTTDASLDLMGAGGTETQTCSVCGATAETRTFYYFTLDAGVGTFADGSKTKTYKAYNGQRYITGMNDEFPVPSIDDNHTFLYFDFAGQYALSEGAARGDNYGLTCSAGSLVAKYSGHAAQGDWVVAQDAVKENGGAKGIEVKLCSCGTIVESRDFYYMIFDPGTEGTLPEGAASYYKFHAGENYAAVIGSDLKAIPTDAASKHFDGWFYAGTYKMNLVNDSWVLTTSATVVASYGDHLLETVTVAPTCADGSVSQVCSICGYVASTEVTPAVDEHNYVWTIVNDADPAQGGHGGTEIQTCTVCGATTGEARTFYYFTLDAGTGAFADGSKSKTYKGYYGQPYITDMNDTFPVPTIDDNHTFQYFDFLGVYGLTEGAARGDGYGLTCSGVMVAKYNGHVAVDEWVVVTDASTANGGAAGVEAKLCSCGYAMETRNFYYMTFDAGEDGTLPEGAAATYKFHAGENYATIIGSDLAPVITNPSAKHFDGWFWGAYKLSLVNDSWALNTSAVVTASYGDHLYEWKTVTEAELAVYGAGGTEIQTCSCGATTGEARTFYYMTLDAGLGHFADGSTSKTYKVYNGQKYITGMNGQFPTPVIDDNHTFLYFDFAGVYGLNAGSAAGDDYGLTCSAGTLVAKYSGHAAQGDWVVTTDASTANNGAGGTEVRYCSCGTVVESRNFYYMTFDAGTDGILPEGAPATYKFHAGENYATVIGSDIAPILNDEFNQHFDGWFWGTYKMNLVNDSWVLTTSAVVTASYGNHLFETVTVPATCGVDGSITDKCSICGYVNSFETIPATGEHTFAWATVTDADPSFGGAAGSEIQTCTVCGTTTGEARAFVYMTLDAATGEFADGSKTKVYKAHYNDYYGDIIGGDLPIPVIDDNHAFINFNFAGVYGLTQNGLRDQYGIAVSGIMTATYSGHVAQGDWLVAIDASHDNGGAAGTELKLCACGEAVEARNFYYMTFDAGEDGTLPDGAANCYKFHAGENYAAIIGSDLAPVVTDAANKHFDGWFWGAYKVSLVNDSWALTTSAVVTASYGDHIFELTNTAPATCTETGLYTYTCSACDYEKTEVIPALGHTLGEWVVTTPATCTQRGVKTRTCTACNEYSVSTSIPALGHSYVETINADGTSTYTCSVCQDSYITGADAARYTSNNVSAKAGDTIQINVALANNPGIISLRSMISYDDTALELLSVTDAELLAGYTAPNATLASPYTLRWANSLATENNTANGTFVTLTFKVKADAPSANYEVIISNTEARNAAGEAVQISGTAALVSVVGLVNGDVDGDGEVTDWDGIVLDRYLAGWDIAIVEAAADIDGDGEITDWDGILLARYLAGWDVTL